MSNGYQNYIQEIIRYHDYNGAVIMKMLQNNASESFVIPMETKYPHFQQRLINVVAKRFDRKSGLTIDVLFNSLEDCVIDEILFANGSTTEVIKGAIVLQPNGLEPYMVKCIPTNIELNKAN